MLILLSLKLMHRRILLLACNHMTSRWLRLMYQFGPLTLSPSCMYSSMYETLSICFCRSQSGVRLSCQGAYEGYSFQRLEGEHVSLTFLAPVCCPHPLAPGLLPLSRNQQRWSNASLPLFHFASNVISRPAT